MAYQSRYNFKYIGKTFKYWPDDLGFQHQSMSDEDNVFCLNTACRLLHSFDREHVLCGDVCHRFPGANHLNTEEAMIYYLYSALIEQCGNLREEHKQTLRQKDTQQTKTVKVLKDKLADEYDRGYEDGVKMHHALNDP